MKKISFILLFVSTILSFSCNKNRIYEKHRKNFTNYRWESSNILEYNPVITDTASAYKLYVAFRHIYGFQHPIVDINVEITSPSGKVTKNAYKLVVIKGKRKYLSDCAGDYCDLETLIEKNYKFKEQGTYTFKIEHLMENDPVRNVMEVGLIIDKIPQEQKNE